MTSAAGRSNAGTFAGREEISACLIVKNEERRLARCLASVRPWVAEIVVVDTGSTDGTVAIAASFGAQVAHRVWRDDFAWARNESLALATRPWALIVDADDVLVVDDAAAFAAAVTTAVPPGPAAFAVDYHDQLDAGGVQVAPVLRLFRRDAPDMRYQGEVHEQVVGVARGHVRVERAGFLHLVHDGHLGAVMAEHDTLARNLRLARRMTERRAEDAFAWFCLGQALWAMPDPQARGEAVAAYEAALVRRPPSGAGEAYEVSLYLNLIRGLIAGGAVTRARARADEALAVYPHAADLRLLRGQLASQAGDWPQAQADYEACLAPEAASFFVREHPGATSWLPRMQLGVLALKRGARAEAKSWLAGAAEHAPPDEPRPRLIWATALLADGDAAAAAAVLSPLRASHPEHPDVRRLLAELERVTSRRGQPS